MAERSPTRIVVPVLLAGAAAVALFWFTAPDTGPQVDEAPAATPTPRVADAKKIDKPPWLAEGAAPTPEPTVPASSEDLFGEMTREQRLAMLRDKGAFAPRARGNNQLRPIRRRAERALNEAQVRARDAVTDFLERNDELDEDTVDNAYMIVDAMEGELAEVRAQLANEQIDGTEALKLLEDIREDTMKDLEGELGVQLDDGARKAFSAPQRPGRLPVPDDAIVPPSDWWEGEPLDLNE